MYKSIYRMSPSMVSTVVYSTPSRRWAQGRRMWSYLLPYSIDRYRYR